MPHARLPLRCPDVYVKFEPYFYRTQRTPEISGCANGKKRPTWTTRGRLVILPLIADIGDFGCDLPCLKDRIGNGRRLAFELRDQIAAHR
jgi:hypothetical protein